MFSFLVADMILDKLQETFPTQRCAAPWPLNCIEKREFCVTRAYLHFTKADCYDIYIWCNQETQHELQHLATLQQQSFATAVICTCPYVGYVSSPVALQQLISLVLTKRLQLWFSWPAVFTHALWLFSFPVFLGYLHLFGGPYFHYFSELLSSFASKMDPKRQLKIKTGVLKRYVSFAENFSQMRRMYNTLPFLGCTNYNLRVILRIVIIWLTLKLNLFFKLW